MDSLRSRCWKRGGGSPSLRRDTRRQALRGVVFSANVRLNPPRTGMLLLREGVRMSVPSITISAVEGPRPDGCGKNNHPWKADEAGRRLSAGPAA